MKGTVLAIGIKPKSGGPPPPPPGMKDIPGHMGMSDDTTDDADPEAEEEPSDTPKTAEEFMAAVCDMCRKYEEAKAEDESVAGEESGTEEEPDDSGYGPQA